MRLRDKRVMLTGAASGIGLAMARELHRQGARLILVDRDIDGLRAVGDELGEGVSTQVADLSCLDSLEGLSHRAIAAFGGVDILINNAGVMSFVPVEDELPATIERLFRVNVVAPMQLTRLLVEHFRSRSDGQVVNVGSIYGSIAFAYFATYSASKFAMRGYSEALRRELEGTGIGVTYLAPRATRTPLAGVFGRMAAHVGMNMDEPETVARRLVRALERDRKDVYVGFPESLFVRINAILPRFVDRALRKQNTQTRPFAQEAAGVADPPRPASIPAMETEEVACQS